MDFFERLEEARNRWNVLSHPFYERWESGELGEDELAYYAGEYRHAVVALAETAECVRSWTAAADELEALAILYAVESGQPAISETKLAGLVEHYGYSAEGPATAYFRLHSELDRAHADQARRLLEQKAGPDDEERLLVAASGALAGNWTLLDGVQHAFSVR